MPDSNPPPPRRKRLGELLVEAGLLSDIQLKAALLEQRKWGGRLGKTVVEMGFVTEDAIAAMLGSQLRLRTVDLDAAALPARVTDLLRLDVAERYGVFPLGLDGNVLYVATSDPTNLEQLQEIEFAANKKVEVAVAPASAIDRAIRRYYFGETADALQTLHPRNMGIQVFDLGAGALGAAQAPAAQSTPAAGFRVGPTPVPAREPTPAHGMPRPELAELRKELAVVKEQLLALEGVTASQVRALKALLEILIESGLVTRDEYLARLHERGRGP